MSKSLLAIVTALSLCSPSHAAQFSCKNLLAATTIVASLLAGGSSLKSIHDKQVTAREEAYLGRLQLELLTGPSRLMGRISGLHAQVDELESINDELVSYMAHNYDCSKEAALLGGSVVGVAAGAAILCLPRKPKQEELAPALKVD